MALIEICSILLSSPEQIDFLFGEYSQFSQAALRRAFLTGPTHTVPNQISQSAADRLAQDIITLLQSIDLLSKIESEKEAAEAAAQAAVDIFDAGVVLVYRLDEDRRALQLHASFLSSEIDAKKPPDDRLKIEDYPLLRQVIEQERALSFPVLNADGFPTETSAVLFPLISSEDVQGVLFLLHKGPPQSLRQERQAFAWFLSEQAGAAFQRIRERDRQQHQNGQLQWAYQTGLALNASLNLQHVLDHTLRKAVEQVEGATHANIFLIREKKLLYGSALWIQDGGYRFASELRPGELQYRVVRSGKLAQLDGNVNILYPASKALKNRGKSIGLPLKINGRMVGVLAVVHPSGRDFTADEILVLQWLAEGAAIAVDNAQLFEKVSLQARTDPLTGLSNRRALDERLEDEVRRSARYRHQLTLMMLDLDGFKEINDNLGHPAGDRILKQIADYLRLNLRKTDFLARYGGDEFAILLPETDLPLAQSLAERLTEAIINYPLALPQDFQANVSFSLGLATYPIHAITASALVIAADQALYKKKAAFRHSG